MPIPDYRTAAAAYQSAIADLYARPPAAPAERGAAAIPPAPDLPRRAQVVIDRSAELGQAAAHVLQTGGAEQRELAQLQLLAAAAADLAVANDLAQHAEGGAAEAVAERGPALPAALADLRAILDASPEGGLSALAGQEPTERAVGPSNPQEAREALHKAAGAALDDIRDDAARAVQAALSALLEIPAPPLQEAAQAVFHELMTRVSQGLSALLARAVGLVLQAVDKICKALGQEGQGWVRQKVVGWIDELKGGTLAGPLLGRLYELERIQAEVDGRIRGAPADTGAGVFNGAGAQVQGLVARFGRQRRVIEWVVRGLAWARPWIMGLQPWGPLGLTGAYVALLGYVVCAGGDYVDWYRTGDLRCLDIVPGVRSLISQTLPGPDAEGYDEKDQVNETAAIDEEYDEPRGR